MTRAEVLRALNEAAGVDLGTEKAPKPPVYSSFSLDNPMRITADKKATVKLVPNDVANVTEFELIVEAL